jgi:tRNA-specific adenosine deaminase 3
LVRREQLEEFSALWPCQYLEVIPDTEPLLEGFEVASKEWMRRIRAQGKGVGCAIVNWEAQECVAMAFEDGAEAGFDGHAVMKAIAAVGERNRNSGSGQLFCTGYVAIATHEPCVMCSMALLHARVRCVVFGSRCKAGGLAGAIRIGSHPAMNHKFNVYGGCLAEEDCNCPL